RPRHHRFAAPRRALRVSAVQPVLMEPRRATACLTRRAGSIRLIAATPGPAGRCAIGVLIRDCVYKMWDVLGLFETSRTWHPQKASASSYAKETCASLDRRPPARLNTGTKESG